MIQDKSRANARRGIMFVVLLAFVLDRLQMTEHAEKTL